MKYITKVPKKDGYYWCKYIDFVGNIQEEVVKIENKGEELWFFKCDDSNYLSTFLKMNNDVKWFEIQKPE